MPTAADRLLATRLGAPATGCLAAGQAGVLVGLAGGAGVATPLVDVVGRTRSLDAELLELARVLSL